VEKPALQMRSRPHKHNQTQTQCNLDHQITPHVGLIWTLMGDFRVICGNMPSGKVWRVNMARGSILLGNAVFAQFTRAKLGTFVSSAYCRYTKGNISRDITHLSTSRSLG
jgi:hypothetical protein